MRLEFAMVDDENGRTVQLEQDDLEHLDDVLELFLTFLNGIGYSYVNKIGAIKDSKQEHWTL